MVHRWSTFQKHLESLKIDQSASQDQDGHMQACTSAHDMHTSNQTLALHSVSDQIAHCNVDISHGLVTVERIKTNHNESELSPCSAVFNPRNLSGFLFQLTKAKHYGSPGHEIHEHVSAKTDSNEIETAIKGHRMLRSEHVQEDCKK